MAINEDLRLSIKAVADTKGFKDVQSAAGLTAAEMKRLDAVNIDFSKGSAKVDNSLKEATGSFVKLDSEVESSAKTNKKYAESLNQVDKAVGGVIIGLTAMAQLGKQVGAFLSEAGAQAGIRTEFQRLAVQAKTSGAEVLAAMENVAQGTISAQQQMAAANKLFLSGMDITASQIGQLMTIARARAVGMGISVEQAFDDITRGITRSSPLILDNLGIILKIGEVNQAWADDLGITVEAMSAQQKQAALLNATLEHTDDAMAVVIAQQGAMATSVAVVATNWENFGNALQAWAASSEVAQDVVEFFNDRLVTLSQGMQLLAAEAESSAAAHNVLSGEITEGIVKGIEYNNIMREMLEATGALSPELNNVSDDFLDLFSGMAQGNIDMADFENQYRDLVARVEDPAAREELERTLHTFQMVSPAGRAIEILGVSLQDLTEKYGPLSDAQFRAAEAARELAAAEEEAAAANEAVVAQNEARAAEITELFEGSFNDRLDLAEKFSDKIVSIDDGLQNSLTKSILQGEQKREDIRSRSLDKQADTILRGSRKLEDIGIKTGDKLEDINLKFGDGLEDDDKEIAGARLSVHRDFWQEMRRISRDSSKEEAEGIRNRDVRQITSAREQSSERIEDARSALREGQDDIREDINERNDALETARDREIRNANIADDRMRRDANRAQQRGLQDVATATERALDIQRIGEGRSIEAQETAAGIKRQNLLANQAAELAIIIDGYTKKYNAVLAGEQRLASVPTGTRAAGPGVLQQASSGAIVTGTGFILTGTTGRRKVR